jgi:hypothetical protein
MCLLQRPRSDAPPTKTMLPPPGMRVVVWECREGGTSPEVEMSCHEQLLLMQGRQAAAEGAGVCT